MQPGNPPDRHNLPDRPDLPDRHNLLDWLYLPDGMVPLISRLVGLVSLPIGLLTWFFSHSGCHHEIYPQPFNVPTWRFGTYLLPVPLPPEPVNLVVFCIFVVGCLQLMRGKWSRLLYIYMATVLVYYTARDFLVCCWHWVLLDFLLLVCLAFRASTKGGSSPTRRLIQMMIFTCYLFGALQKIFYPDFMQGISLEAFYYDGYAVTEPFKQLVITHPLPMSFWQASSVALVAMEILIGFALFFPPTRLLACALGLILHGGILVTMDWYITLFSIEMWTGYLAFFPGPRQQTEGEKPGWLAKLLQEPRDKEPVPDAAGIPLIAFPKIELGFLKTPLALAFMALMLVMPMRIYFLPGPPPELLTLFERTPWGFGMFLLRQRVAQLDIVFEDSQGKTQTVPVEGRMKTASNDNELISIADYVLKNNPQAKSIRVNDLIVVNERRNVLRTLIWDDPSKPGSQPRISVTLAGDYCRGAANRNLESDRHL